MSISASIDISLTRNKSYSFLATDIVDAMLSQNWKARKSNKICYLPLADDDLFNWSEEEITELELKDVVSQKENEKEIIGIVFYWGDTDVGVSMLIFQDYQISFNLNINRVSVNLLDKIDITDASWYLQNIIPCFNNEMFKIEDVKFNHTW